MKQTQSCSVATFLALFGDAWTLLILRDAFFGATRFTEFQRGTGAARNLLSDRLTSLVAAGLLEKVNVGRSGTRYAYHLTDKGRSLEPLLAAMAMWSNHHLYAPQEAPTRVVLADSGAPVTRFEPCTDAGPSAAMRLVPGPGADAAIRKRLAAR